MPAVTPPTNPGTALHPAEAGTLVELLRARAAADPRRRAYTFLIDGEVEGDRLDFGELDRRARAIAARIQGREVRGERVLLLHPAGPDFVGAFFGALYAGAVAVPAPVGDRAQLQRTLPRLQAIARDAEPALVLTTSEDRALLEELFGLAPELKNVPVVSTDDLEQGLEQRWRDPGARPTDLAFLQYTSGSTAAPKGVMVSHANLLYTARDIDAGWHYDEKSVVVTWLPIFHDMGLICGIVLPAYKGFHCYIMTPVAFVQKPVRWLASMSRYGGTHSAAPNFAYDLCVRKISEEEKAGLDLSRWRVTLDSAEPVRRETIERFSEAFAACGFGLQTFCPGFGLAEATVKVTSSNEGETPVFRNVSSTDLEQHRVVPLDPGESGRGVRSLVGNGRPILETRVVIANPETHERCATDQIGEIWVAGPCVCLGYWRRPEETESTFQARLADGEGPFLRTGDLGFQDSSGELFCTGRIKDLIILRGRNFYPQDIELAAEKSHGAIRAGCSAAFSIDVEGEERLVLACEIDPRRSSDPLPAIYGAIRSAVVEEIEVHPFAVLLSRPRTIPKTSSGKIQRRVCRELLLGLGLDPLGIDVQREGDPLPSSGDGFVRRRILAADEAQRQRMVEFYLLSLLAPTLPGVDPSHLDLEAPLVHQGLDFPMALDWVQTIAHTLGPRIAFERFFSRMGLKELAAHLLEELSTPADAERAAGAESSTRSPEEPPGAAEIEDWMIARIAALLGRAEDEVEVHRPFSYLGLDSMMAVDLAMDLEDWLGRPLPSTLVWDHPTIEAAARHLAGEVGAAPSVSTPSASKAAAAEPIAIIGMACRFPGANSVEDFWKLLHDGVDAITEAPRERWSNEEYYDPKPGRPGKLATKWGGFIDDVELFDAAFFGISAREAARMDPQQRILLEVTWEALEDAGLSPDDLAGSLTGVWIGKSSRDYLRYQLADIRRIDGYASTGNASSVASGRISYVLDLRGPNMAIDTACSSSLVAIHDARRGLLSGECDVALAGGVNLTLTPHWTISFSHAHMMARDGRCKTFDAAADGYVRGEGCGIIVMKRLSDAIRDGDDVLAVIRGSAVNHDGRSNGITAPSGLAQQAVIRQALREGGVRPSEIGYVEAHGTGTPLGDPIEALALAEVLGEGRTPGDRCIVGSVKTNIGHLEPASGVAGLIKVVLALQKDEIPPHIHLKELNPHIPIDDMPLEIATKPSPWNEDGRRRFAGVSAFGFAGTNAHLVLEEAPRVERPEPSVGERTHHILCLSARREETLRELAARLGRHVETHVEHGLADVCHTMNVGRAHMSQRAALIASSREELASLLCALGEDAQHPGILRGATNEREPGGIVFLFRGMQSISLESCRELFDTQPAFRRALRSLDEILRPHVQRSILALDPADPAQAVPAAVALGWALAETWRSFGLEPARVVGAGAGVLSAAACAGALQPAEALELALEHGRVLGGSRRDGLEAALRSVSLRSTTIDLLDAEGDALGAEGLGPALARGGSEEALATLGEGGCDAVLEMSLETGVGENRGMWGAVLESLGRMYVAGRRIDWTGFDRGYGRRRLHLPRYPFQRKPYWVKPAKPEA